jgi:YVTN family beta-propeller protein
LALAACGGNGTAGSKTTTTSTLPPLPPKVIAYVALAGTGTNLGYGTGMVPVDVTVGSDTVGTRLKVGTYPDAVAVTPSGRLVLVANFASNTVTPVLEPNGTVLPDITVGQGPAGIAITPNGKTAYVTNDGGESALGDTVTPINLETLKAGKPITVGDGPQGIAITPDGRTAYVADAGAIISGQSGSIGDEVTPINLVRGTAGSPIKVGNAPLAVAITPDGSTVFVTNLNSESVSPINVASNVPGAPIGVAGGPVAIAMGDDHAWVVNAPGSGEAGNNVQAISLATDRVGRPIPTQRGAQSISITPDDSTAWVACLNANSLVPIDLATARAGTPIRVLDGPFAVAIANQPQTASTAPNTSAPPKKKKAGKSTTTTI